MISNSGHDEHGKYSGGVAGDQTGGEWSIIPWYNRPWNVILRYPDQKVREEIALLAEHAAKNDLIGYDQGQRTTFWQRLKESGYDPAQIKVACEADCSAGVLAIVKAVGCRLGVSKLKSIDQNGYTGNEKAILKSAGFKDLTSKKYTASEEYLLRGDILLYEGHHTAINLTDGVKAKDSAGGSSGSGTSGTAAGSYRVGEAVWFKGSRHYASAAAVSGPTCKPGPAKVTQVSAGAKHPYHLVAEKGGGSTVYGWVNAGDIEAQTEIMAKHRVVKGDKLSAIACKYGTTVSKILAANKGRYPSIRADYIVTGWTLDIPN